MLLELNLYSRPETAMNSNTFYGSIYLAILAPGRSCWNWPQPREIKSGSYIRQPII